MDDLLKVGVITSTHGIRGEVKVFPTTDDPKRFLDLKEIILDTGKEKKTLSVQYVKFFKNMVILKFKEFDNINDVEIEGSVCYQRTGSTIRGKRIFHCRSDRFKSRFR